MAEQEVVKHTKKVYKIWRSKEHGWGYKLREFLIEILIIVFAVSISLWLHNWSEHKTEQRQVRTFLLGLRTDLETDIAAVNSLVSSFKEYDTTYTYLSSLRKHIQPDKDSLHKYLEIIKYNSSFRPHTSRFNGFLSAGKMLNIESDSLVLEITELYQQRVAEIYSSVGGWAQTNGQLNDY